MPSRSSPTRVTEQVKRVRRKAAAGPKPETVLARMRRRRAAAKVAKADKLKALNVPAKPAAKPKPKPAPIHAPEQIPALIVPPNTDHVKLLSVVVPAGIGDFSWIYSKLMTLGVKLRVRATTAGPLRLGPFLKMLPDVVPLSPIRMQFTALKRLSAPPETSKATLLLAPGETYLQPNVWLESGKRLEGWLPELDTNLHYPLNIDAAAISIAQDKVPSEPYVCLFAGNEGTARNWHSWRAEDWVTFMREFRQRIRAVPFVLIGAKWDKSVATEIMQRAKQQQLPVYNLVAQLALPTSLQVMIQSAYFVAFPSGLGILANVLRQPATMFYPNDALRRMPGTWSDPATVASHEFHETVFIAPELLVTWLCDVYGMRDRFTAAEEREETP